MPQPPPRWPWPVAWTAIVVGSRQNYLAFAVLCAHGARQICPTPRDRAIAADLGRMARQTLLQNL